MKKNEDDLENLQSILWEASCQIRALGEMLMFQSREPSLDECDIGYGYGSLIRKIGERIEALSLQLDRQVERSKKR